MRSRKDTPKSKDDVGYAVDGIIVDMMSSLKEMISVDTIVGDPLVLPDGATLVPISKVTLGFVAGGGEFSKNTSSPPFAGGSGAGLTVEPIGFILKSDSDYKFIPALDTGYGKLVEETVKLVKKFKEGLDNEE